MISPCQQTEGPWEGNSCGYHTIFQDGPIYRMYYRGWNHNMSSARQTHPAVVCYAEGRDGRTFHRWAEAFIRPGLNPDKWHDRSNYIWRGLVETQSPLPGGGKELSLYTNEGYYYESKAAKTRRYTCRIDGFVSLHASYAGGKILTKPLIFEGDNLLVNFSTSSAVGLQVQVEALNGRPAAGFAFSDCPEIYDDAIEYTVKWRSGSDLSTLGTRALKMLEAKLADITFVVAADCLARLQTIPIVLDLTHGRLRAVQYHRSPEWLEEHGYARDLVKCVHIREAAGFVAPRQVNEQPWVILHELAHAYHDQVLGFHDASISGEDKVWQASHLMERAEFKPAPPV